MNSTTLISATCNLCGIHIGANSIQKEGLHFCCPGCQAVYTILETKQELSQGCSHPLFEQAVKAGLISNPQLLDQMRLQKHDDGIEWTRWHFEVQNLWCPACAEVIKLLLLQEKGIKKCLVDYATDIGVIEFAPRHTSKDAIKKRLDQIGYRLIEFEDIGERQLNKNLVFRLTIAAFCATNIMMVSYPVYIGFFIPDLTGNSLTLAWLAAITSIPVISYCSWPIITRFLSSLRIGYVGMEALIIMGVAASFFLSVFHLVQGSHHVYFDSMSMIIVFVLLGKLVETKAKFSMKNTLMQLSRSLPRRCRKKSGEFVKAEEMQIGDRFIVLAGEKIPLDGLIVTGLGCCDESVMTGESMPVNKEAGNQVLAGTMLVQGNFEASVTRTAHQTALSRIVDMVTHDLDQKHMDIPLVDKVVRWFVPIVTLVSIATAFLIGPLAAIAVLLIACPCALGIAAPLAEAQLINSLASLGVIVRNRRVLQWLGREDIFYFDKTGTVTKGELKLISGLGKLTPNERAILKALVLRSTHPLCTAMAREIEDQSLEMDFVEEVIGKGMRGSFQDGEYRYGSAVFTGIDAEGSVFSRNGELISVFQFEDELRPEMRTLNLGVPSVLLSGDRANIVEKVARECGFDWKAEVAPLQKRACIESAIQQHKIVGMVGDGINDAPALALAHVSVSVLSASDISIQVSDLLLTTANMQALPQMRILGQQGRRIIKQNLFWAFAYNIIGIYFAATGTLSPIYATIAMVMSSLFVIFNAQRICREKLSRQ